VKQMNEHSVPTPQGNYIPALRHGDMIFTSGMTPRENGVLQFVGPVRSAEDVDKYRDASRLAASNALTAARAQLKIDETIGTILNLIVFVNSPSGYKYHSRIADFASSLFVEELGPTSLGTRSAVGVSSLPSNATLEIQIVALVRRTPS
jgi:enamine deaminase RidA (YjgF/YER057c/UK114 family)